MGLLRRMESGIQRGFEGVFDRGGRAHVQPPELMRKLVREMDVHKTASLSRTYVPNRFTVYLRSRDRDRFRSYEVALVKELETHLLQHVRREGYDLVAPVRVSLADDDDLSMGQFGILAEMSEDGLEPLAGAPLSVPRGAALGVPSGAGSTQSISRHEASVLDLARQTLFLGFGAHVQEFEKSRVIIGRARDADFRLDDPNVSRQHALVYWEDGRLFIRDLGSTNGTLVNGRQVTSAIVTDGDVISVGGAQIRVGTG